MSHTVFSDHHILSIIASYGASAILCFNANLSPLAQPRNVLFGHFIASLIGTCFQKLFLLSEAGQDHYYVAGALSVAVLSVAMTILNCTHPPAGASALLPCIDEGVRAIGWWFLPAQLVSSVLIIATASITGNIIRVYPTFWWTSGKVGKHLLPQEQKEAVEEDLEIDTSLVTEELSRVDSRRVRYVHGHRSIQITKDGIIVPDGIQIEEEGMEWLETFQRALSDKSKGNEDSP